MNHSKRRLVIFLLFILASLILLPLSAHGLTIRHLAPISKPLPAKPGSLLLIDEAVEPVANCRYGVTTRTETNIVDWVDDFGAGWFMDFLFFSPPATNGAEFVPIVYVEQDKDDDGNYLDTVTVLPPLTENGLGREIDRHPGRLWIIGNEVDRGPGTDGSAGVGDTFPDAYARTFHVVYQFIKERDPSALVGISGLVEVTPGRLQYLDEVWHTYQDLYNSPMPVDVWNMHLYVLPEVTPAGEPNNLANVALGTDPGLGIRESGGLANQCHLSDVYCVKEHDDIIAFEEQIVAMRSWMKEHGQRQKPLILSEYSILYPYYQVDESCALKDEDGACFTPERVRDFMGETFTYLENAIDSELGYSLDGDRLVQQWLWYSIFRPGLHLGHASNLITADVPAQFTPAGELFRQTTFSSTLHVNLLPGLVSNPNLILGGNGATVTATLTLAVHNNGTQRANGPFEVAFYRDSQMTDIIGLATVPGPGESFPGMTGCGTRYITVAVEWAGLPVGEHPFWVKVDYLDNIDESDEEDNVTSGIVKVNSLGIFLPSIIRS